MSLRRPTLPGLLLLGTILLPGCLCDPQDSRPPGNGPDLSPREVSDERRPSSLLPPPREPGPARLEAAATVKAAGEEARRLTEALKAGGVDAREVAAVADMRGYRLYRKRYFRQAQVWFETAALVDPSFEPALFNAARCAVLLEQPVRARERINALKRLNTPLARSRLDLARQDPDFASLWTEAPPPSAPPTTP